MPHISSLGQLEYFFFAVFEGAKNSIFWASPPPCDGTRPKAATLGEVFIAVEEPTPPCTVVGPLIAPFPHLADYQRRLRWPQFGVIFYGLGPHISSMFFRNAAAAIHPELETRRFHIPEIVIHYSQEPSIQHHNAICEIYTSMTSGKGMLWSGWVGKFSPKGRGGGNLNLKDNVFDDSTEDPVTWGVNCRESHGDDLESQSALVDDEEDWDESGGRQQWWETDGGDGEEGVAGDASDPEGDSDGNSDEDSEDGEIQEDDGRQWWEMDVEGEEEISAEASDSDEDSDGEDFDEVEESDAESGDDESESGSESEGESEPEEDSNGDLGNEACDGPSILVQQSASIAAGLLPHHAGPSSNVSGSTASSMSSPILSDNSAHSTPSTSPGTPVMTLNKREVMQYYNRDLGFEDICQVLDSYRRSEERVHRMLP